ncbi:MAG: hypothetical protein SGJ19_22015 [Planctomycetia bacterium]|nr:hypothetical protein [Planctomycetia bacterium]
MAIVLGPRSLLTCAHVINQALGSGDRSRPVPRKPVLLEFPLLETSVRRLANVVELRWFPLDPTVASDVAVLELAKNEDDIPPSIGYALFADVIGRRTDGDSLSTYGRYPTHPAGKRTRARFVGSARGDLVQVDSVDDEGRGIGPGFSGGGVYDDHEQALIGMVQGGLSDPEAEPPPRLTFPKAALMLSTPALAQFVPGLRVERRRRPAWFWRGWSFLALALLVMDIAHHWVSQQGKGGISALALESIHAQLAAFWGMHLLAVLGPIVFAFMFIYARDFSCSHWSERIPPFPFWSERWLGGPRPMMSTVVVLFFVVVPIVSQVHFLLKFHGEGTVYAKAEVFGLARQANCIEDFCPNPGADRYRWLPAPSGLWDGYFNDAYRYGERRDGIEHATVTYWPVLTPVIVEVLSLTGLLILIMWLRMLVAAPCPSVSFPKK